MDQLSGSLIDNLDPERVYSIPSLDLSIDGREHEHIRALLVDGAGTLVDHFRAADHHPVVLGRPEVQIAEFELERCRSDMRGRGLLVRAGRVFRGKPECGRACLRRIRNVCPGWRSDGARSGDIPALVILHCECDSVDAGRRIGMRYSQRSFP